MNKINKEHFKTIQKAIDNNKLAVFVGSAISYDSGLPSWSQLIKEMKNSLEVETDDYLKIPEHYYLQYGQNAYYNKINGYFPSKEPNELHELILNLKPQHIITTNWDDLLEKTISNNGDLYFSVATDDKLASSPNSQLLVKMHGDLAHRNIIFKESDYHSYPDKFPLIENFIKSLFSTHIVLFIGYSISDYNLNQILSWIKNRTKDAPPTFSILVEDNISISEINYLKGKGVYPLTYNDKYTYQNNDKKLSPKSIKVAGILNQILHPENDSISDILTEILSDIANWEIIHPTIFTQLLKDKFNITKINKIYYDSGNNAIIYNIDEKEKTYDRYKLRNTRKNIIKFLKHIPIDEIRFQFPKDDKYYRIKNFFKFDFINDYTTFDFEIIKKTYYISKYKKF